MDLVDQRCDCYVSPSSDGCLSRKTIIYSPSVCQSLHFGKQYWQWVDVGSKVVVPENVTRKKLSSMAHFTKLSLTRAVFLLQPHLSPFLREGQISHVKFLVRSSNTHTHDFIVVARIMVKQFSVRGHSSLTMPLCTILIYK